MTQKKCSVGHSESKNATTLLAVTSPNADRFLKSFSPIELTVNL